MKEIFTVLKNELEKKADTVLCAIVKDRGSAPRGRGALMLAGKDGRLSGTLGGGPVEYDAEQQAKALLAAGTDSFLKEYRLTRSGGLGAVCGGNVTVLFTLIKGDSTEASGLAEAVLEAIQTRQAGTLSFYASSLPVLNAAKTGEPLLTLPLPIGERAVLFGGGHIAAALCPLLAGVGFRVTVMDCREEFANRERFPEAEEIVAAPYENVNELLGISSGDYVVIMTNGHAHDEEVEEQILRTETAYVGVIGSRAKTAVINKNLLSAGIPQEKLDFVHTPIGTPIKAVTPEEIAISIAGEMILVRACSREKAGETAAHACPMH